MPTSSGLSVTVRESKSQLTAGRARLRKHHDHGTHGIQVGNQLADLFDAIVHRVFDAAVYAIDGDTRDGLRSHVAVIPHGGYGRRDVAPFSDIDLLLLHHPHATGVEELAHRILADLSDIGMNVGFATRTPRQARQLARRDPVIFTSQAEARFLVGSKPLFERFMDRFRRNSRRLWRTNLQAIEAARREERAQFGETVHLLEPNVKRSRGGLRDIQFLRWIGFTRYGASTPHVLRQKGLLRAEDERALRKALDFLLRIRNELHFHAGRPYDVLYRSEQVRIAEQWNIPGNENLLPVEELMSTYFEHTTNVRNIVAHFLAGAKDRNFFRPLVSPFITFRLEEHYRVGPVHIGMSSRGRKRLKGNLAEVLRLMDLANQTGKYIEYRLWNDIRQDMRYRDDIAVTEQATERFISLLSGRSRLGTLLFRLHEVGALEKLIVGMDHARCLLQFNSYHKYTVDEHSIRAVGCATRFSDREDRLGQTYRSIKDPALLHLALLIHDLGKGLPGDHSEVGAELAIQTARKLALSRRTTESLEFLVRKHLMMAHLTFRRDTSDENVILQFATEVGSPELLKMLFVLTAADLDAVGPDVLNPWKIGLLADVYQRADYHLRGDVDRVLVHKTIRNEKLETLQSLAPEDDREWYTRQFDALSPAMLSELDVDTFLSDLKRIRNIATARADAWGRYLPNHHLTEYIIGLNGELRTGTFHRLTGVLTSMGLEILSASIRSLEENLLVDRFLVQDPDHEGRPPNHRIDTVCRRLIDVSMHPAENPPVFRKTWMRPTSEHGDRLQRLPTRVVIDNSTVPDSTIVDIFTNDRVGLLYTITRVLYELNLSVSYAKIGTYLDQVVDIFYVTDLEGNKIKDEMRLESIRESVLHAIAQMPDNATAGDA